MAYHWKLEVFSTKINLLALYVKIKFSFVTRKTQVLNSFHENHDQRQRYQRHIANVSITPVIITSALQICNALQFFWPFFQFVTVQWNFH